MKLLPGTHTPMKILFTCRGNNCRSQIAEAIYNRLTNSSNATSAGTQVEINGETIGEARKRRDHKSFTVDVMRDSGFNVEDKPMVQLTKDMLAKGNYDLVVNMAAKRYTPAWLANTPNYVYWKVTDPRGRSYELTKRAKDEVERRVWELAKRDRSA